MADITVRKQSVGYNKDSINGTIFQSATYHVDEMDTDFMFHSSVKYILPDNFNIDVPKSVHPGVVIKKIANEISTIAIQRPGSCRCPLCDQLFLTVNDQAICLNVDCLGDNNPVLIRLQLLSLIPELHRYDLTAMITMMSEAGYELTVSAAIDFADYVVKNDTTSLIYDECLDILFSLKHITITDVFTTMFGAQCPHHYHLVIEEYNDSLSELYSDQESLFARIDQLKIGLLSPDISSNFRIGE